MVSFTLMKCFHFSLARSLKVHQNCKLLQQGSLKVLCNQSRLNVNNSPGLYSSHSQKLSTKSKSDTDNNQELPVNPYAPEKKFAQIYKFPYIAHARVLCRLKIYQTFLTVTLIPGLYFLGPLSSSPEQLSAALAIGTFACFMLGVMGEIFRKFVGIVYYNPDEKQVCIAHLTFWGDRCNSYFHVDDVVPFGDHESNLSDIYVKLHFYSKPSLSYWITLRYGLVVHEDYFFEVFRCLPSGKEN